MLAAITIGSFSPNATLPESNVPSIDKLVHFFSYTVLSLYFASLIKPSKLFYVGTFCFLWSLGIEVIQPQFDNRYFEWFDLLANALGVSFGCWLEQKFNVLLLTEKILGVK